MGSGATSMPHGWDRLPGEGDVLPLPLIPDHEQPFWEGAQRRELLLQGCGSCGKLRFPLSPVCPWCLSTEVRWQPSSGRGTIRSWTTYHRAFHPAFEPLVPYTVAWVGLDEGVGIPTRLTDVGEAEVSVGMPVEVVFEDLAEAVTAALFRPLPT